MSRLVYSCLYLWSCTADLADVAVVQLWLLGGALGLLQLALVERRLLVGVVGRGGGGHGAAHSAPGGAGQLLGGGLLGRRWLGMVLGLGMGLRVGLRLGLGLGLWGRLWLGLGCLVVRRGGGVTSSRIITGVADACERRKKGQLFNTPVFGFALQLLKHTFVYDRFHGLQILYMQQVIW